MRLNALTSVILLVAMGAAWGQSPAGTASIQLQIPDVEVLNQDGQQLRFNSGLVGDRVAVINTMFTACKTVCPVAGANFGRLAKKLGARLGRDVILVSVSIDPLNDTPERLKAWSEKFHAVEGWTLVTGVKPEIDRLLKSLGLFAPERQDHSSTVLIGSSAAGWTRASALASPDKLLDIVEHLRSNRKGSTGQEKPFVGPYLSGVTPGGQDHNISWTKQPAVSVAEKIFVVLCSVVRARS
jgi:protein SCO1/2